MWELLAAERTVETEINQPCQIRYYILVEEAEAAGNLLCETYGVRIATARDGKETHSESMRQLTFCLSKIDRLIGVLADCLVTPAALQDVVEDWVAAG